MSIKCKTCGFGGNEPANNTCIKCGEHLEISHIVDMEESGEVNLKETTLREVIINHDQKKQTRILPTDDDVTQDALKVKSNPTLFDETYVQGMPHTPKDPVKPKQQSTSSDNEKKKTLFVEEFKIDKEDKVAFELIPLGEEMDRPKRFFTEEEVLSRNDIDDTDYSISSKEHVKFTKTETGWKMKNLSSNGALFVRVEGEIEIKENDIVIIGKNKTFLFKPKS